jgi:hypothetical protein
MRGKASAVEEGQELRDDLGRGFLHQPVAGAFDDDALDPVGDEAALLDRELVRGLLVRGPDDSRKRKRLLILGRQFVRPRAGRARILISVADGRRPAR